MDYEWDPIKAKSNLAKHDISFTDAAKALEDPYKLEDVDLIRARKEIRSSAFMNRQWSSCSS